MSFLRAVVLLQSGETLGETISERHQLTYPTASEGCQSVRPVPGMAVLIERKRICGRRLSIRRGSEDTLVVERHFDSNPRTRHSPEDRSLATLACEAFGLWRVMPLGNWDEKMQNNSKWQDGGRCRERSPLSVVDT